MRGLFQSESESVLKWVDSFILCKNCMKGKPKVCDFSTKKYNEILDFYILFWTVDFTLKS